MPTCRPACAMCSRLPVTMPSTPLILADRNATRDGILNEVSFLEQRVVVTKDSDFYYSHLLHGRPWKLVLVRTGNLGLKATRNMFETHLPAIKAALHSCTMVEIDQLSVSIGKQACAPSAPPPATNPASPCASHRIKAIRRDKTPAEIDSLQTARKLLG